MSWEGKQGQHHKISQATLRVLVFILRATEIHWGLLSREVTWQVWPFVKIGLAEAWRMVLRTGVGSPKYIRSDLDKGKTKMCWHITSGPLQLELFVQHWFWDMSETVWGRWDKEACLLLPYVLLFGPPNNTLINGKNPCHTEDLVLLTRSPEDHLTSTDPSGRATAYGVLVMQTVSGTAHTLCYGSEQPCCRGRGDGVSLLYPLMTSNLFSPSHISSHFSIPIPHTIQVSYSTDLPFVQLGFG